LLWQGQATARNGSDIIDEQRQQIVTIRAALKRVESGELK